MFQALKGPATQSREQLGAITVSRVSSKSKMWIMIENYLESFHQLHK